MEIVFFVSCVLGVWMTACYLQDMYWARMTTNAWLMQIAQALREKNKPKEVKDEPTQV